MVPNHHAHHPPESSAAWLDELWSRQEKRLPLAQEWWRMAGGHPGARAVDVGCGPGRIALAYADWAGERGSVLAVDTSRDALAFLENKRDARRHAHVSTRQLDLQQDPLPSGQFDVVFATDMLHHVERPGAIFRHLRPTRATLLVGEFDPEGPGDMGPPLEARLPPERVLAWLRDASWVPDAPVFHPRFEHYSIVARAT